MTAADAKASAVSFASKWGCRYVGPTAMQILAAASIRKRRRRNKPLASRFTMTQSEVSGGHVGPARPPVYTPSA